MARQRARAGANGRALLGSRDAEILHLPVQHRTLHPQAGGGSLGSAHHPARLAEGSEDVLPLGVGERERRGGRGPICFGGCGRRRLEPGPVIGSFQERVI